MRKFFYFRCPGQTWVYFTWAFTTSYAYHNMRGQIRSTFGECEIKELNEGETI